MFVKCDQNSHECIAGIYRPLNEQMDTFNKGLILFLSLAIYLCGLLIAKNANRNVRQRY